MHKLISAAPEGKFGFGVRMACLRFPAGSLLPLSGRLRTGRELLPEIDAGQPAAESGGKPSALQKALLGVPSDSVPKGGHVGKLQARYWEWRAEAAIFWACRRVIMLLFGKCFFGGNEKWRLQAATPSGGHFVLKSALVGLFALLPVVAHAQPPALSTNTISLPSGPGSIEGLGESFEPQLNTGSYVFRLPFKLPPVRGKAQPEVAIVYNSGNGNGPLGLGWNLRIPFVQRQTDKGLPRKPKIPAKSQNPTKSPLNPPLFKIPAL